MSTEEEVLGTEEEEATEEPSYGSVRVFFHTGAPVMIDLDYGETVTTLRQKIRARGRSADGLSVLLDGQHVLPDNEPYQQVTPGSSVVFSGSVKGG